MKWLAIVLCFLATVSAHAAPKRIELDKEDLKHFLPQIEAFLLLDKTPVDWLQKGNALDNEGFLECQYKWSLNDPKDPVDMYCLVFLQKDKFPDPEVPYEGPTVTNPNPLLPISLNVTATPDQKEWAKEFIKVLDDNFGLQAPFEDTRDRHVIVDFKIEADKAHEKGRIWLTERSRRGVRWKCGQTVFELSEDLQTAKAYYVRGSTVLPETVGFDAKPYLEDGKVTIAEAEDRYIKTDEKSLTVEITFGKKKAILQQRRKLRLYRATYIGIKDAVDETCHFFAFY